MFSKKMRISQKFHYLTLKNGSNFQDIFLLRAYWVALRNMCFPNFHCQKAICQQQKKVGSIMFKTKIEKILLFDFTLFLEFERRNLKNTWKWLGHSNVYFKLLFTFKNSFKNMGRWGGKNIAENLNFLSTNFVNWLQTIYNTLYNVCILYK